MHAKTNHTLVHVSDDISSLARVSNDICNPTRVSDDISGPIKLWHVSPIKFCHMSLTHLQTLINRSLPKAFEGTKTPRRDLEFKSPEALLEPSPEAFKNFKNFNFEYEEHSKRNHTSHLPRS